MHASWAFIGRLQWCSHPRWTIIFWPKMLYEQLWTTCMLRKYRAFFYHHFVFRIKWTPNGFHAFATRYKELTMHLVTPTFSSWSWKGEVLIRSWKLCTEPSWGISNPARGLTCQSPKSGYRQQLVGAFSEKCLSRGFDPTTEQHFFLCYCVWQMHHQGTLVNSERVIILVTTDPVISICSTQRLWET